MKILKNTKIPDNSIVGAGAIVNKKFEEKCEYDRSAHRTSKAIWYYDNNPLRQCTGNCSICRRQGCPLDSK